MSTRHSAFVVSDDRAYHPPVPAMPTADRGGRTEAARRLTRIDVLSEGPIPRSARRGRLGARGRNPVLCQKPIDEDSCRGPMVEVEQAADPFAPHDGTIRVRGVWRGQNQPVREPLMVSFAIIVVDELRDDPPKMPLPERHDPIETLASDRKHESLGEGVQVGTPRRQPDDFHAAAFEGGSEPRRLERIPIEYQVTFPEEEPVLDIERVACDLFHPGPVGPGLDPRDLDLPGGDVDQEEDVVPNQPDRRDGFDGEEVGGGDRSEMRLGESSPGRLLGAERGRYRAPSEFA